MYGSVSWWTEWCYWHRDSILKQTLMLMDKTGLRKGKPNKPPRKPLKPKKHEGPKLTEQERDAKDRERAIQMAVDYGIGYLQYKEEVDGIRAQRIRERLETYGTTTKE